MGGREGTSSLFKSHGENSWSRWWVWLGLGVISWIDWTVSEHPHLVHVGARQWTGGTHFLFQRLRTVCLGGKTNSQETNTEPHGTMKPNVEGYGRGCSQALKNPGSSAHVLLQKRVPWRLQHRSLRWPHWKTEWEPSYRVRKPLVSFQHIVLS